MGDLTQLQALEIARWRFGDQADAGRIGGTCVVREKFGDPALYGNSFIEALRASMQSPMTDEDAELEAKIRWGMAAKAWVAWEKCVGPTDQHADALGRVGVLDPWERAFYQADRRERHGARTAAPRCPDLTPAEATETSRLWALNPPPSVTEAVDSPDKAQTCLRALENAERRLILSQVWSAATVREQNKREGQRLLDEMPDWPYPAAWRAAVAAGVEWCNARPVPEPLQEILDSLSDSGGTTLGLLKVYHLRRLRGETAAHVMRDAAHGGLLAMWQAYERSRPGGGR